MVSRYRDLRRSASKPGTVPDPQLLSESYVRVSRIRLKHSKGRLTDQQLPVEAESTMEAPLFAPPRQYAPEAATSPAPPWALLAVGLLRAEGGRAGTTPASRGGREIGLCAAERSCRREQSSPPEMKDRARSSVRPRYGVSTFRSRSARGGRCRLSTGCRF